MAHARGTVFYPDFLALVVMTDVFSCDRFETCTFGTGHADKGFVPLLFLLIRSFHVLIF